MEKSGPVIIGFQHFGEENACKIIAALRERRLKEGDTVAIELTPMRAKMFQWLNTSDNLKSHLSELDEAIKLAESAEAQGLKLPNIRKSSDIRALKGETIFFASLEKFLSSKGVKLLHLESDAHYERGMKAKNVRSDKNASKKAKRLARFVIMPINEKYWKKRLEGTNPRFILVGAGHVPAVKRMVPYKEAVETYKLSTHERVRDELVRLKYRAEKGRRRFIRRMKR